MIYNIHERYGTIAITLTDDLPAFIQQPLPLPLSLLFIYYLIIMFWVVGLDACRVVRYLEDVIGCVGHYNVGKATARMSDARRERRNAPWRTQLGRPPAATGPFPVLLHKYLTFMRTSHIWRITSTRMFIPALLRSSANSFCGIDLDRVLKLPCIDSFCLRIKSNKTTLALPPK